MTPRAPGGGGMLRRDVIRGTALAVLVLLVLWGLLRSSGGLEGSLGIVDQTPSHLRRIAELRPVTLTSVVSKGRPSRVARFISVKLPGVTSQTNATEHATRAGKVQPLDVGRIWEYLLGQASRPNIGWELGQPEHAGADQPRSSDEVEVNDSKPDDLQLSGLDASHAAAGNGTAPAPTAPRLPGAFDWHTYLMYYPDLRRENITTEAGAQQHYLEYGRAEHRVYRRLRVLLRYTACTGLMNQHYSHIAAFTLAAAVNAELVLPPAVQRDSFAHYFSQQKELNEVVWTPAPLEWLLDVDRIIGHWAGRGMTVHKTPALVPFPDLTEPHTAFPLYPQPELDVHFITKLPDVYLQNLELGKLVDRVRSAVVKHARAVQAAQRDPDAHPPYIVLDLPCTFFMLHTQSAQHVVGDVARSLSFAPLLEGLAQRIVANMTQSGKMPFNAAHLRIEKDARDWSIILGGEAVVWDRYIRAMQKANFSASMGMYTASGLLTYGAGQQMADIEVMLKHHQLCSNILYKEQFLPAEELGALSSEQKALLDFLVLAKGEAFVGFGTSTFSFYLREYRALQGVPRSTSVLVDASIVGTDPLFYSAGILT